jgi:DNA-binding NtrC family response regulator
VDHFIEKYNRRYDENVRGFTKEALEILPDYPWPGNVRELENVASRAVILSQGRSRAGVTVLPDILPGYEPKAKLNFHQSGESTRAFILGIIKEKQKATVKGIQEILKISDKTIRDRLHDMTESGLLRFQTGRNGTLYYRRP